MTPLTWQGGVLVALVGVPLLGCLAVSVLPARLARGLGVGATALTFAGTLVVLFGVLPHRTAAFGWFASSGAHPVMPTTPWRLDTAWLPAIDVRFSLAVDGISLPLVVLTGLLTFLCAVHATRHLPEPGRPRGFVALLLLLEVGMLGTFLATDLILFFVFFELVLAPMYFLIAIWGGSPRRGYAATKFILYTLLGSAFLLIGFVALWAAGRHSFAMIDLAVNPPHIPRGVQDAIFAALLVGFGIKTPMWPLHTWLPDAHTEAPTAGSVLLAGVLLKMGTYGFIRIALPTLPQGAHDFAPWLGVLGGIGIVYGATVCLGQRELKRLIAFSSVGHMGFVLLGIATLTPTGINAALFGNIAHGLVTGLLFFLVGAVKERYHTDEIAAIGGGALYKLPQIGGLLGFAAIASLGLPGLAGFWGEMLSLFAAYHPAAGLSRGLFFALMGLGGLGAVLTASYFLRMLLLVDFGVVPERWRGPRFADAGVVELAVWAPLVVLVVAVGLWPRLVLGITDGAVRAFLGGGLL